MIARGYGQLSRADSIYDLFGVWTSQDVLANLEVS